MNSALLSLHSISKSYMTGTILHQVISNISCQFYQGTSYAIVGPSGCGKSTLLYLLAGLEEADAGTCSFNDISLTNCSSAERSHLLNTQIGFMFQQPHLINELSVIENIMLKGLIQGISYAECEKKAYALLDYLGLVDKAHHNPCALSGGQQQRVALLRAIFNRPAFLVADEPTGNLDAAAAQLLIELLQQCQRDWNMGIIVATHDTQMADAMDRRCILSSTALRMESSCVMSRKSASISDSFLL